MRKNQLINQAQHIFTASGLIRDHIFKAHADKSKKDFKDTKYRELTHTRGFIAVSIGNGR
ncbi:MAG: hypothetical protein JRJ27_21125 [Deltaproteobacteria bacterium]|nr:hypothetical protein [Deltaproteobacteria bacterium]